MHKFRRSDRIECALLAGTVCGVLTGAGVFPWWMTAVFAVIMAGFFRKYALISAVVVLAGSFFISTYASQRYTDDVKSISSKNYDNGKFELLLCDPRMCSLSSVDQPAMIAAELRYYRLNGMAKGRRCSFNVLVKLPEGMACPSYGTVIRGRGSISTSSDRGFGRYLKAHNIVKSIYLRDAKTVKLENSVKREILLLRDKIADRTVGGIENADVRNFAASLFFGITGGMNHDRRSVFVETGTIHIFSVSGMHVAVLAGFIFLLFRWLGLVKVHAVVIVVTGIYVISTGASAPAVRAYLMIFLWAALRMYCWWMPAFSIFCWASTLLLLTSPMLVLDVGARYSIAITGVLIAVSERYFKSDPKVATRRKYKVSGGRAIHQSWRDKLKIRTEQALFICTAAFVSGAAISLYHNGQFLLLSIPVNLVLTPLVSLFYLFLGCVLVFPWSSLLLELVFKLFSSFCTYCAGISYNLPAVIPSEVEMWLYIFALYIFIRFKGRVGIACGILVISLLVRWIAMPYSFAPEIWIYNNFRRPACVAYIDSSNNFAEVIDPSTGAASAALAAHLKERGVTGIERVSFSRNSTTAARGLRTLLRRCKVKSIHLAPRKRYERFSKFKEHLLSSGAEKLLKEPENEKNLKIFHQKGSTCLEYFNRRAKLNSVLLLIDKKDGRDIVLKAPGYCEEHGEMKYGGTERIYRYEFKK
ncbi:MAG: ComEC/Rec2 family competence protein [Lentisphaeria bacterium]|nr:ComEC/Rec2 family competence protein [Lentisphaeria bacterium]